MSSSGFDTLSNIPQEMLMVVDENANIPKDISLVLTNLAISNIPK